MELRLQVPQAISRFPIPTTASSWTSQGSWEMNQELLLHDTDGPDGGSMGGAFYR